MVKITEAIATLLSEINGIGYFGSFGAVIGEDEFIIYYPDDGNDAYLAHSSEFETKGCYIRLKEPKNV